MDIDFAQFDANRQAGDRPSTHIAPLDWRGLAARLTAAHAARQILASTPNHRAIASGSFAPALADRIAAWRAPPRCEPE